MRSYAVILLLLAGCPARPPLPGGPPPEYEPPRGYDPDKNIDTLEAGDDDGLPPLPAPTVEPVEGGAEPEPEPGEPPAEAETP
jgi:hypothetical protein